MFFAWKGKKIMKKCFYGFYFTRRNMLPQKNKIGKYMDNFQLSH